uniref:Uncharacterized protein n=1 Tax=Marmota marmota marmota TaxID=9994 RepID=A0A8C6EQ28_MARMA
MIQQEKRSLQSHSGLGPPKDLKKLRLFVPVMKGKVPDAALRSDRLKKQQQTSQESLQRSPSLDLPQVVI